MDHIMLSGFMKIELNSGETIRLCDGAFYFVDGELYQASDPVFGVIGGIEPIEEGLGDEVPAFDLTILPPDTAGAVLLSRAGQQGSRARFWLAELEAETGLVVGTPDLQFDGQIDTAKLRIGRSTHAVDLSMVPRAERLFAASEGNDLSSGFHKRLHPGELGEDNATGLGVGVAWGTEAQRSATAPPASSSGGIGYDAYTGYA